MCCCRIDEGVLSSGAVLACWLVPPFTGSGGEEVLLAMTTTTVRRFDRSGLDFDKMVKNFGWGHVTPSSANLSAADLLIFSDFRIFQLVRSLTHSTAFRAPSSRPTARSSSTSHSRVCTSPCLSLDHLHISQLNTDPRPPIRVPIDRFTVSKVTRPKPPPPKSSPPPAIPL